MSRMSYWKCIHYDNFPHRYCILHSKQENKRVRCCCQLCPDIECEDYLEKEKKKELVKGIYTRCSSFEEADNLGLLFMRLGYEGVQNDSYRYCRMAIRYALNENLRHHLHYCYIGVNGYRMVVGRNHEEMKRQRSSKYIEKERIFRQIINN